MRTEVLKLASNANQAAIANIEQALKKISGVNDVNVSLTDGATVQFDPEQTSVQELQTALARTGFGTEAAKTEQARKGGCCGGCCS